MKINIIVANCFNGGIGKSNKLPFSFKKDLAYFSKITKGKPYNTNGLLMGRNTWDSLPIKPLPYRDNYVVSRSMTGDFVFNNIDLSENSTGQAPETYELADKMSSVWINFARTGNPNVPGKLPEWEAFTPENGTTMFFNNTCEILHNHDRELMALIKAANNKK